MVQKPPLTPPDRRVATGRAFALRPPVRYEDDLHAQVARALDLLLLPPAQWSTFPAGHFPLPPAFAAKLSRLGMKRSWPDLLIVYGGIYGIELKREGASMSRTRTVRTKRGALRVLEGQATVFPRLRRAGMKIEVCYSLDEVLAALRNWNIPTRVSA